LLAGLALLFALGAGLAGEGLYLSAKARLAQFLLNHAWDRTLAGAQTRPPWPGADTHPIARLRVPARGIDRIILADSSARSLAFGPGHVPGTARPGEPGPSLISGHRDTHFRFLQDLRLGDELVVERTGGTSRYVVSGFRVIDIDRAPLVLDSGADQLVLATCFPFRDWTAGGSQRYLVYARSNVL
jgi:sortase A